MSTASKHHPSDKDGYQPQPHLVPALPGATWTAVAAAYLAAAVDSDHTRRAYARHLGDAGLSFGDPPLTEVSAASLASYRSVITTSGLAPASQAQALAAIRSFLAWAGMVGAHRLPAEAIRAALRTPRASTVQRYNVVSEPEIAALLSNTPGTRERALIGVLLGAGLRVAEAAGLDVGDVLEDQDGGVALLVRMGKGRKDRVVPIRPDVDRLLREYLAATGRFLGDLGPLFLARDRGAARRGHRRLSPRSIAKIVRQRADAAGIAAKRVSPHALRHTFAIRSLRQGGNVVAVSRLLGHTSIATTQRYVDHLALGELRSAVPALPAWQQPA